MNKELLQERKKMIYDFICDELYVPMKAKEMALAKGKTIIVDPAPAAAMPEEFWKDIYVKNDAKDNL